MPAKAPRNRTVTLTQHESSLLSRRLMRLTKKAAVKDIIDHTINQRLEEAAAFLPEGFVDLLFIDPPYNLTKTFRSISFKATTSARYKEWMNSWLSKIIHTLKPTASIYICGDWRSSSAIQEVAERYFIVQNRITWEREKGRGAKANWKNVSEDIWFCTMSRKFMFDLDSVKVRRRVIAPYTENGKPKDWKKTKEGNFR
ncbi:MAG TPA: DNA methyltransferase, partial [Terriglobia bacterium]|nr:DNA methyltransferase [Terriglobia bacterium]